MTSQSQEILKHHLMEKKIIFENDMRKLYKGILKHLKIEYSGSDHFHGQLAKDIKTLNENLANEKLKIVRSRHEDTGETCPKGPLDRQQD